MNLFDPVSNTMKIAQWMSICISHLFFMAACQKTTTDSVIRRATYRHCVHEEMMTQNLPYTVPTGFRHTLQAIEIQYLSNSNPLTRCSQLFESRGIGYTIEVAAVR